MSKKKRGSIVPHIINLALTILRLYIHMPAINIKSHDLWLFVVLTLIQVTVVNAACLFINCKKQYEDPYFVGKRQLQKPVRLLIGVIAMWAFISLIDSRLFRARSYSQLMEVEEGTIEDIPSVEEADSIALMDTASAEMLGDREIGMLDELVSQFDVGGYTQIDYNTKPVKVSALEYSGFFKWLNNKNKGVPGYVVVDPVKMDAEYMTAKNGMKYVPSAWFNENLYRVLWFHYPTLMFRNIHCEINENGTPHYIAPYYDHKIGILGGTQVIGAVVFDPATKEMAKYSVDEIPEWVDVVFDGDLICTRYDDFGQLHKGFINSVFGQEKCKMVTKDTDDDGYDYPDFGYVSKDKDIWVYTGITSVTGDSSDVGFILSNERTGKTKYIQCPGANEFSAMASAQGLVQEKAYRASFPSLIRIEGMTSPSYIMVLKDAAGLVRMYSIVNVSQYNLAATAVSQEECISKYKQLINGKISSAQANSIDNTDEFVEAVDISSYVSKMVTIRKIEKIVQGGDTYIYIVASDDNIYSAKYTDVIEMITVKEGDSLTIMTNGNKFVLPK